MKVDQNFEEVIRLLNIKNRILICHGTLLESARDNELIPWDHDIDIAVWQNKSLKRFINLREKMTMF